jgi:hypothetical protein
VRAGVSDRVQYGRCPLTQRRQRDRGDGGNSSGGGGRHLPSCYYGLRLILSTEVRRAGQVFIGRPSLAKGNTSSTTITSDASGELVSSTGDRLPAKIVRMSRLSDNSAGTTAEFVRKDACLGWHGGCPSGGRLCSSAPFSRRQTRRGGRRWDHCTNCSRPHTGRRWSSSCLD